MFLDGQKEQQNRYQHALAAAVIAENDLSPRRAWPEYFGAPAAAAAPSTTADMSGWTWEKPTPQSFADDMAKMMEGAEHFAVPEPPPVAPPPLPVPRTSASMEWL